MPIRTFRMFRLPVPFFVGKLWTIMCVSCKSKEKPVKQARMPTEGLEYKYSFYAQETYQLRALSWFSPEKGGRGQPPANIRRVVERHNIVNSRQTDFGFGVDAQAGPGNASSPDTPLPVKSSPHDLCHGWDLPWWLLARYTVDFVHVRWKKGMNTDSGF